MRRAFAVLWAVAAVAVAVPLGWEWFLSFRNHNACPSGWICDYFTPAWKISRTIGIFLLLLLAAGEAGVELKRLWTRIVTANR